jgi:hypothetical protein
MVVMIEELELLNRVIYAAAQSSTTLDLTALDRVLDLDESPARRDAQG